MPLKVIILSASHPHSAAVDLDCCMEQRKERERERVDLELHAILSYILIGEIPLFYRSFLYFTPLRREL